MNESTYPSQPLRDALLRSGLAPLRHSMASLREICAQAFGKAPPESVSADDLARAVLRIIANAADPTDTDSRQPVHRGDHDDSHHGT